MGEHRRAKATHSRGRILEGHQHRATEVALRDGELLVIDAVRDDRGDRLVDDGRHLAQVFRTRGAVHGLGAGIQVGRGHRRHRVGQAPTFSNLLVESTRGSVAEGVVHHPEWHPVTVERRDTTPAEGEVHLFDRPPCLHQPRHRRARGNPVGSLAVDRPIEPCVDRRCNQVVVDCSRNGEHEVRWPVPPMVEAGDLIGRHPLERVGIAQGLATE